MINKWRARQLQVCKEQNVSPVEVDPAQKVGIAMNVKSGILPINGVRHLPEHGTCGWYIWAGEMSEDPDFFVPLHAAQSGDVVRAGAAVLATAAGMVLSGGARPHGRLVRTYG